MRIRTSVRQTNVLKYNGMTTPPSSSQTIVSSIRLDIQNISEEFDMEIHDVMRRQQSAMRMAYNRFADKLKEDEVYTKLCALFPKLTAWDVNAAIVTAKAVRASQTELLPGQIAYLVKKIEKFKKKKNPKPEIIEKISKLQKQLAELEEHLKNGTVPAAIFGGKKLWKKLMRKVPGALEEWRDARSDEYFSRGESKNEYGNRHFRLTHIKAYAFQLEVRVPDEKNDAKWLPLIGMCSEKHLNLLTAAAFCGSMITVRLMRRSPDHYQAFITVDEVVGGKVLWDLRPGKNEIIGGIDLNLDHAAVALVDWQGQFRDTKIFPYPNLGEMQKGKTEWMIGNLAKEIVGWAKDNSISTFVLENLKIDQEYNTSTTFNRRTVTFAHRQLSDTIQRTALRNGVNIRLVNPAYTSWIGKIKYAERYGISVHEAAAYVIGRRGIGFQENLPQEVVKKFPEIAESVKPKNQKEDGKKNKKFREWHKRLTNWQENTPEAGKPWLLWATLNGIYLSGLRSGNTDRRNYPLFLFRSGGNTPPATNLSLLGQEEQNIVLARILAERPDARAPDKAGGQSYVEF